MERVCDRFHYDRRRNSPTNSLPRFWMISNSDQSRRWLTTPILNVDETSIGTRLEFVSPDKPLLIGVIWRPWTSPVAGGLPDGFAVTGHFGLLGRASSQRIHPVRFTLGC